MKTKYVCRGLISLYVNFHNNRTMWSTNLYVQFCRWGEREKEPIIATNSFSRTFHLRFDCVIFKKIQKVYRKRVKEFANV